MGEPIDMSWKEWELIYMTLEVTSFMTLNLDFQGQILKYLYVRNGMGCGWVCVYSFSIFVVNLMGALTFLMCFIIFSYANCNL